MPGFTPTLRLPALKKKGLTTNFHGIKAPYYVPTEVMLEGCPVKFDPANVGVKVMKPAALEGALVIGLALQEVYSETGFDQLAGYHFANDTRQRLDGSPIGVLMGQGWCETRHYGGTVTAGQVAYVGASDPDRKLVTSGGDAVAGNILPAVFESGGIAGDVPCRLRFNFKFA